MRKLVGARDAWSLMSLSAGAMAANPFLMTMYPPEMLASAAVGSGVLAGIGLGIPRLKRHFSRVDVNAREDFVLPSDKPICGPESAFHLGYTTDTRAPIYLPYELAMRHCGLIGASGVGKTTLGMYLIYQHMVNGGGFIFIDAKIDADTRDTLAYLASACGRPDEFYILNPDSPSYSNSYNPILDGDADEVASRLLNLQPSSEDNPGADYYRQSAYHALTTIAGALKRCGLRYHFTDLTILLQSAPAMESLLRQTPPSPERMALEVFLDKYRRIDPKVGAILDVNKMKDTLGGMAGRIATFAQGKFGEIFNTYTPEINLTDIMLNNKMLYVMLPTMGKDAAALNLGKMLMSDIRSATYNLQGLPKSMRPWPPFLIFADEMGSYVMEGIARLFEQARSANICLVPGFQSFGNLASVSDQFSDIIIQNTWSKVYYRFGSVESAELASEMMGKSIKYVKSVSQAESAGSSADNLRASPHASQSASGNRGETWREDEANRVTTDHLRALGIGQAVVTIGPRVYHIDVPRITTPIDLQDQEHRDPSLVARPWRHPIEMPAGERGLNLGDTYMNFMMATKPANMEPARSDTNKS